MDGIRLAIWMLNNKKGLQYTLNGQKFDVIFDLSEISTDTRRSAKNFVDGENTPNNIVNVMKVSRYDKKGKLILGNYDKNKSLIQIHYSSVGDSFTIAHEIIHALGGNNSENGVDRHSADGLMSATRTIKGNSPTTKIYQQTVNDIIEKGSGPNYKRHIIHKWLSNNK